VTSGVAIRCEGLSKRYANGVLGVDSLQLEVPRGTVFGLLGANGAGKTTTLRLLVGLIRPTAGSAWVAGHAARTSASRRRTGALLERFGLYPYLSGRSNLRVIARYCGLSDRRVEAALEEVRMIPVADRRFGTYSLGMQQRIALAAVLMREPEVILLDEPTNGLDPQGIVEFRALVRTVAATGRTVLMSSHHLSEVEQMCDLVAVISGGRVVTDEAGLDVMQLRRQARSLEDVFFELTSAAEARSA
jgi:ABC-2 type transport system ATP-binding protein